MFAMRRTRFEEVFCLGVALLLSPPGTSVTRAAAPVTRERMVEWTIESRKSYSDPFNDVDVDVVFGKDGQYWHVPTFWRGGQRWTVRFAPPAPGTYKYHLESTDKANDDLNGHEGEVTITAYKGTKALLAHGALRVSTNKRYFEHTDGTPFYWLGDTWWTGLSSRLSWKGFQELTADRKAKGFTVVQTVAGLVPSEEVCPADPGCQNEGGAVWEPGFARINPRYFDYADRRIEHLVSAGIVPAIVGGWSGVGPSVLDTMGIAKFKQQWRYIIARYGAYPTFWILGGEVFDPPEDFARKATEGHQFRHLGEWSEVAQYIRSLDPYHHPLTVHEVSPDDPPLQHEALTDFRLFQPGHSGWASIDVEVGQLNLHYARTEATKPLVVGEIGYEMLWRTHLEDFQRTAFWLAMLNGAAGYTYGAAGTWESYTADKPSQRMKLSLLTWDEGMHLPGSYEVGLGAKLLRRYPWWQFQPHPDWITPHGTTLLEPRAGVDQFHVDLAGEWGGWWGNLHPTDSEWKKHDGNFRLPYAAGVPRQVRVVYIGQFGQEPPTIFALEPGVRYRTYYWEPSLGVKVDLGAVERPIPGAILYDGEVGSNRNIWTQQQVSTEEFVNESRAPQTLFLSKALRATNVVVSIEVEQNIDTALVLRYQDINNFLAATYSSKDHAIYFVVHKNGKSSPPLGRTLTGDSNAPFSLTAEVREEMAIVALTRGGHATSSAIIQIPDARAGDIGLLCACLPSPPYAAHVQVRASPVLARNDHLEKMLYDAAGRYRGLLGGAAPSSLPGAIDWSRYGKEAHLLLNAYRPEVPPFPGDWVLLMDAITSNQGSRVH